MPSQRKGIGGICQLRLQVFTQGPGKPLNNLTELIGNRSLLLFSIYLQLMLPTTLDIEGQ